MISFSRKLLLCHISKYITNNLKDRSDSILRLWADHCEYILAQRFRRGQQMICLYTKMWEDRALKELLQEFKRQVHRHAKGFIFSAAVFCIFDWERERITNECIQNHLDEISFVQELKQETITCLKCKKRKVIDYKVTGIEYCMCAKDLKYQNYDISNNKDWVPYIERKNMIVWRKEEKPGLYAYKVYVTYEDITAEDFLHVQTDIEYRKQWDRTAIVLDVVDIDPAEESNSHVIYWEMLWPKLFANRDYVYNRRYKIDATRNVIVIVNKSTLHPKCPQRPQNQRVYEYWSYMVIKPKTTFTKPGLEFVLTYFDNPGVALPTTITTWVAQSQMPEFLNKLHNATIKFAERKQEKVEKETFTSWDILNRPEYEYSPDSDCPLKDQVDKNENGISKEYYEENSNNIKDTAEATNELREQTELTDNNINKTSWWSYLHPYYYFV